MITFVYPWINPGGYAEKELRMSLRSLGENVLGDYRVFVIGDCPATLADITYVPHDRTLTGPHAKCVDAVRKLELAIATPQIGEHFVYMADDIALLAPFHPNDVAKPVALYEVLDGQVLLNKINDALVQRTVNALRERGLKRVWYYETHMPRLFEKRKLQEVLDIYKPAENGLMIPTLYFNHHFPEQEPIILHKADNLLARCTGRESETTFGPRPGHRAQVKAQYLNIFTGKRYLNWNDDAISQGFVDALLTLFPKKATHETSTNAYVTE